MKHSRLFFLVIFTSLLLGCQAQREADQSAISQVSESTAPAKAKEENEMKIEIANQTVSVKWADNPTVEALRELVDHQTVEIQVQDYAGMEKVGYLPQILPSSNQPLNTDAGDITLYQGKALAFYYGQNSYSLTPIGKIQSMSKEEIRQLLTSQEQLTIRISMVE